MFEIYYLHVPKICLRFACLSVSQSQSLEIVIAVYDGLNIGLRLTVMVVYMA